MSNNPSIELWAIDEVMFQQFGTTCKMWIPPEDVDPIVYHFPGRKKVGFFGAVRLSDGKFVHKRIDTKFNAETCFSFLKRLRRITAATKKKISLISDNARYHHATMHKAWRENCSDRFELNFLPPYSPELNPIERVWKITRRSCTHNRYFESMDSLIESVENKFDEWKYGNDVLRRLCAIN
jgi:transposase